MAMNPVVLLDYAEREIDERPYRPESWKAYRRAISLLDAMRNRPRVRARTPNPSLVVSEDSVEDKTIENTDPDYLPHVSR